MLKTIEPMEKRITFVDRSLLVDNLLGFGRAQGERQQGNQQEPRDEQDSDHSNGE